MGRIEPFNGTGATVRFRSILETTLSHPVSSRSAAHHGRVAIDQNPPFESTLNTGNLRASSKEGSPMTIAELGSLGEFLAAFGVFATLIFLILQIRQNTAEMRLRNTSDRSDTVAHAAVALMGANAYSAYTKAVLGQADLADDEVMQVWAYLDIYLAGAFDTWSAYTGGLANQEEWTAAKASVHYTLAFPIGMVIWSELKKDYPRKMTEDIELYLTEHGTDRVERQFKAMLNGIGSLA
jgi:hypothetical protein